MKTHKNHTLKLTKYLDDFVISFTFIFINQVGVCVHCGCDIIMSKSFANCINIYSVA